MSPLVYAPLELFQRLLGQSPPDLAATTLFADLCRLNALYMIARAGSGHIGSSFSSLDLVTWLHLHVLPGEEGAIYYSSKGHDIPGLYAVLTATEKLPFEMIHRLRRLGGLPGHPDRATTPAVVTNTGSLGMGISKAKGLVAAHRLQGKPCRVYVLTGDGELQEGQIWESLASAVHRGYHEITVIVDHNKLQSDTWVASVNDLGDLATRFAAFGWQVDRCDGHDFHDFAAALTRGRQQGGPRVILADTIKGRGVSFMEPSQAMANGQTLYRFHSGAPGDAEYQAALAELQARILPALQTLGLGEIPLVTVDHPGPTNPVVEPAQRLVAAYGRALRQAADHHPQLVVLDADLALDCGLIPFREAFPQRFFECGIAEQDMVSTAGGMALGGLIPAVHSFACFLAPRPNEHFYNNASEGSHILYVGSLAGLVPGGPGHSHQSVRDIAALTGIPGLALFEPCCEQEVDLVVRHFLEERQDSLYLRLVSIPCPIPFELPPDYRLVEGQGVTLRQGQDGLIIGYGPVLLAEAFQAAAILEARHGLQLAVVNLPWLHRVEPHWLAQQVAQRRHLFTLDNHALTGGQGERIAATLMELALPTPPRLTRFGVTGIPACGSNREVLACHRLDALSLVERIAQVFADHP